MKQNWKNAEEIIAYSDSGITSKVLFKANSFEATLFCMAKGTEMSEHTSTKEGIVSVIEGKGVFSLKGEKIPMLPGTIIHLAKNARHSLKAEKNTSFFLVLCQK